MTRSSAQETEQPPPSSRGVVAVVAVYNNVESILDVLSQLKGADLPVIVVDDGSDDGTTEVIQSWTDREGAPTCRVCRLEVNSGKAAAMRQGFKWARELDYTHALTFDADGQHDASCIPAFLAELDRLGPDVLVVGTREPLVRDYPLRNLVGRLTSNLAIRAQCGVTLGDVPCGMRIYPLDAVEKVRCLSGRYAWEEEFITRAAWAGCRVSSVRIPSIYAPYGERKSHYRFKRDWPEGIAVYLWLLLCSLVPNLRPKSLVRNLRGASGSLGFLGVTMAARTERTYIIAWMIGIMALSLLAPVLPWPWVALVLILWVGFAWHGSVWLVGAALAGYWLGAFGTNPAALVVPTVGLLVGILLVITGMRAQQVAE
ncbi:MAG: glycosyltransferase family 2 protein [Phycisphaerales bacterium]|nr:glycosyltransferase family 2 protein [Phycisphaerales bacterium]